MPKYAEFEAYCYLMEDKDLACWKEVQTQSLGVGSQNLIDKIHAFDGTVPTAKKILSTYFHRTHITSITRSGLSALQLAHDLAKKIVSINDSQMIVDVVNRIKSGQVQTAFVDIEQALHTVLMKSYGVVCG